MNTYKKVEGSLNKCLHWCEKNNYESYDPFDIWSTRSGRWIISTKARWGMPFKPLYAPLYIADKSVPQLFKPFVCKMRYPTAMAQLASTYLRLYKQSKKVGYRENGISCLEWLIDHRSPGYTNYAWGLPFDWQIWDMVIAKETPCSTITPYMTLAFSEAYRQTRKRSYRDVVVSTAEFMCKDLHKVFSSKDKAALSYTPVDHLHVTNVNSYAALSLYYGYNYAKKSSYRALANKLVNYLLSEQDERGYWQYFSRNNKGRNVVDALHNCYIMENLYYVYKINGSEEVYSALEKGCEVYTKHFLNRSGVPKSLYNKLNYLVAVDINDCAETINCMALLSSIFPETISYAEKCANWTIDNMQNADGHFYYQKLRTHMVKIPYIRWAQAPMANALSTLLVAGGDTQ